MFTNVQKLCWKSNIQFCSFCYWPNNLSIRFGKGVAGRGKEGVKVGIYLSNKSTKHRIIWTTINFLTQKIHLFPCFPLLFTPQNMLPALFFRSHSTCLYNLCQFSCHYLFIFRSLNSHLFLHWKCFFFFPFFITWNSFHQRKRVTHFIFPFFLLYFYEKRGKR